MNTNLGIKIGLLVVAISAVVVVTTYSTKPTEEKKMEEGMVKGTVDKGNQDEQVAMSAAEDNNIVEQPAPVSREGSMEEGSTVDAPADNTVLSVEEEQVTKYVKLSEFKAQEAGDVVVLNFYASWCPSCKSLKADIMDNLDDIPSNMTIIEVDYDTEEGLAALYAVTSQHTFVQIDKNWKKVQKWSGGSTLKSVLDKVNSES